MTQIDEIDGLVHTKPSQPSPSPFRSIESTSGTASQSLLYRATRIPACDSGLDSSAVDDRRAVRNIIRSLAEADQEANRTRLPSLLDLAAKADEEISGKSRSTRFRSTSAFQPTVIPRDHRRHICSIIANLGGSPCGPVGIIEVEGATKDLWPARSVLQSTTSKGFGRSTHVR